jgi:hypothetical protein
MLVADLLNVNYAVSCRDVYTIRTECSQFLQESDGLPVYRALPVTYNTFHKVKVRFHKRSDSVAEAFNKAFGDEYYNIVPRGIFAQSTMVESSCEYEPFYVFPKNGYKYAYSKGVKNSNLNFQSVMETLAKNSADAFDITTDLIKYTYTRNNLTEGIESKSEVIFYGIPYFYAVRVSDVGAYENLINR